MIPSAVEVRVADPARIHPAVAGQDQRRDGGILEHGRAYRVEHEEPGDGVERSDDLAGAAGKHARTTLHQGRRTEPRNPTRLDVPSGDHSVGGEVGQLEPALVLGGTLERQVRRRVVPVGSLPSGYDGAGFAPTGGTFATFCVFPGRL